MSKELKNEKEKEAVVVEAVSRTELFFQKYTKLILSVLIALVVVGVGIFCYYKFVHQPAVEEALGQMYPAEANFREGEYELALNGDGNVLGFAQIVEEYGSKAGKSVYLYAGVCELQLGNYEGALKYLKSYNGKDDILAARAEACMGDAYVGLENYKEALKCFEKAADRIDNIFAATYLKKAGAVCEKTGDDAKALVFYKRIKDQYPNSTEGYDIDKYISRIENK